MVEWPILTINVLFFDHVTHQVSLTVIMKMRQMLVITKMCTDVDGDTRFWSAGCFRNKTFVRIKAAEADQYFLLITTSLLSKPLCFFP